MDRLNNNASPVFMGNSEIESGKKEFSKKAHEWENLEGNQNNRFETPLRLANSRLRAA